MWGSPLEYGRLTWPEVRDEIAFESAGVLEVEGELGEFPAWRIKDRGRAERVLSRLNEENRRAFDRWVIRPRVLRGTGSPDTSAEILGTRVTFPVLVAPWAYQRRARADRSRDDGGWPRIQWRWRRWPRPPSARWRP